ncbi:HD domain-containing protein [Oceanobacillus senegalensis]|uniref:HD domain-containing protein n=1 Tax=Oceanobacillus senegalensis TaxID=1936063 RepID=UPI000A307366|nr:HD domain-containing protein [Oceanobacillus senegalensis]
MNDREQLKAIRQYIKSVFKNDVSGHDFYHMSRVAKNAVQIAAYEDADLFITEAAAWLHDVGDHKLFENPSKDIEKMNEFLRTLDISEEQISVINTIINEISFSKGKVPQSLEGKIVQDADRLDAIGAIGIARTFAYGGFHGQLIHHDELKNTSVQHFYDKLLTLKDTMNTNKARAIAEDRHGFMETFLNQLDKEW